ncbi:hypothetical protein SETIT_2G351000v2 [Setaria italica]|uniref:Glycosyltransferase n=1 Tax=Setaria italica TaxID=4555 RepID=K4A3E2_SETIT|nr:UDP-glycosyltransferase 88B1 [Setaria italica]RCV13491.1 hypothetical protein SETIT_2G351000v2 [Setaria italica]
MEKTIVLYPGLAVSHFVPMMQLADVLLADGYAVAVALIDLTLDQDVALAATVRGVASAKPSVTFHTLPRIKNPPTLKRGVEFLLGYLEMVRRYNEHLREFLSSMPPRSVRAVIVDAVSMEALDVTKELGVPGYTFYAMNASALAVFVQLPSMREEGQPSFRELGDTPLDIHGVVPLPASHLCAELLEDPESEIYKVMMNFMCRNTEADGILVNTFASLEERAVGALRDLQILLPGGSERRMPPVYCVGPLVASGAGAEAEGKHECLAWLDTQPERSVVFLCFGSIGAATHSEEQLREIAAGLERSGHRFLWVVRAPLRAGPGRPSEPDVDALLPDGFSERTKGRGLVVKHWAPQVEVLHHNATGAFVTHCGWNSVLEGVKAGVPMLCWPLYSEQKMNKVFMVEEAGIGLEVVWCQQGLVEAGEVEAKVRLVMESEEGERLRSRVAALKDAAAMAWKDGGSSRAAFAQFLSVVNNLGRDT